MKYLSLLTYNTTEDLTIFCAKNKPVLWCNVKHALLVKITFETQMLKNADPLLFNIFVRYYEW